MTHNTAPTATLDDEPHRAHAGNLPVVRVTQALLHELCDTIAAELAGHPSDTSAQAAVAREILAFVLSNMPHPEPWATPDVRLLPMRIELDSTPALMMGVVLSGFVHVPTLTVFLNGDLPPEDFVRTALHESLHVVEALRFRALEVALMETRSLGSTDERNRPTWLAVLREASWLLFGAPMNPDVPRERWPSGLCEAADSFIAATARRLS